MELVEDNYNKKDSFRKYVLAFAVVFDLIALGLIFTAIVEPYFWILIVVLLVISNVSRVLVNLYPKKYNYGLFDNKFIIKEITPLKTREIIKANINDIISIKKSKTKLDNKDNKDKNTIIIHNNSCMIDVYVIEFSDKTIIVPLDEYMYTLLMALIH